MQVQSKKKPKTEAVRSAAPPKKKEEATEKVEELRKNKKVDNDFALDIEDASDDDWDKPKDSKKDEKKKPESDYEDNWDMDDKDLGLEDKTDNKKTEKVNEPPKNEVKN